MISEQQKAINKKMRYEEIHRKNVQVLKELEEKRLKQNTNRGITNANP